ncbi:WD40 repeat domain-containing protein, partial [Mesorhizobium sp. M0016]
MTGGADGRLILWDLGAGRLIREFVAQNQSKSREFYSVVISSDGREVGAAENGGIEIFDLASGTRKFYLDTGEMHYDLVEGQSEWVATDSGSGRILYFNTTEKRNDVLELGEGITTIAFSRVAEKILVTSDKGISIRDTSNRVIARVPILGNVPTISRMSSDGKYIALGDRLGTVEFRDANSLALLRTVALDGSIESLDFSPAEPTVLAVGSRGSIPIVLLDVNAGSPERTIGASIDPVGSAAFSHSGEHLVLAPRAGPIALWRNDKGAGVFESLGRGPIYPGSMALSSDGHLLVTDSMAGLRVWNADTDFALHLRKGSSDKHDACYGAAQLFLPGTHDLVTTDEAGRVLIWDVDSGSHVVLDRVGSDSRRCVAISSDALMIAVSDETRKTLSLWNAKTRRHIRTLASASGNIGGVAFSSDGSKIVAVSPAEGFSLWDVRTGRKLRTLDLPILAATFLPNSTRLAIGKDDGEIAIFDYMKDKIEKSLFGHVSRIYSLSTSVDGSLLISASADGAVKIWDLHSGVIIQTIVLGQENTCPGGAEIGHVDDEPDGVNRPTLRSCWMTFDAGGRFDSSSLESMPLVSWIVGDDPFKVLLPETFMRDYYEPNLLGRLLACHEAETSGKNADACREAFTPVRSLVELNRIQPDVRIVSVKAGPTPDVALVEVEASGKVDASQPNGRTSTGVYDVRLFRDGQMIGQWPEPKEDATVGDDIDAWRRASRVVMPAGETMVSHVFPVRLAGRDRGRKVAFTAYAFNEDRVKSVTATYRGFRNVNEDRVPADGYTVPQDIAVPARPRAYVVTVGVNEYEN